MPKQTTIQDYQYRRDQAIDALITITKNIAKNRETGIEPTKAVEQLCDDALADFIKCEIELSFANSRVDGVYGWWEAGQTISREFLKIECEKHLVNGTNIKALGYASMLYANTAMTAHRRDKKQPA